MLRSLYLEGNMKKRSTAAAKAHKLALVVRTGVKGGRIIANHNEAVTVRTGVKGGLLSPNHNEVLAR